MGLQPRRRAQLRTDNMTADMAGGGGRQTSQACALCINAAAMPSTAPRTCTPPNPSACILLDSLQHPLPSGSKLRPDPHTPAEHDARIMAAVGACKQLSVGICNGQNPCPPSAPCLDAPRPAYTLSKLLAAQLRGLLRAPSSRMQALHLLHPEHTWLRPWHTPQLCQSTLVPSCCPGCDTKPLFAVCSKGAAAALNRADQAVPQPHKQDRCGGGVHHAAFLLSPTLSMWCLAVVHISPTCEHGVSHHSHLARISVPHNTITPHRTQNPH